MISSADENDIKLRRCKYTVWSAKIWFVLCNFRNVISANESFLELRGTLNNDVVSSHLKYKGN